MRASSSITSSSLVVVMLTLGGGCLPRDEVAVIEPPAAEQNPAPAPAPDQDLDELLRGVETVRGAQSQGTINELRAGTLSDSPAAAGTSADVLARSPRRLVFQCSDDVTFAVRMAGARLEVFPPGFSSGFIVLRQQPTDSGVLYTARDALFSSEGDLATLELGRERYVDCVSNPAATVWEEPPRPGVTR